MAQGFRVAVVGAGPVGLALAGLLARQCPGVCVHTFDRRPAAPVGPADVRTLALSQGSVQLLQRLQAWPVPEAEAILQVHVSQQAVALPWGAAEPVVRLRAAELGVPQLGAVCRYGELTHVLEQAWLSACRREPERLQAHFSATVQAWSPEGAGLALQWASAQAPAPEAQERLFDLVVVAEGGVFGSPQAQARQTGASPVFSAPYEQTAWVGEVRARRALGGVAYERFTRHGPAALLPLGGERAALVWCLGPQADGPQGLNEAQRLAVLQTVFHADAPELDWVSPLKDFALGLQAQRTLREGRVLRIGNAAQTLHPVAGQGLNLGLRDAFALAQALEAVPHRHSLDAALAGLSWQRAPDRLGLLLTTDALARGFAWEGPLWPALRAAGLGAMSVWPPLRRQLAQRLMWGWR